MDWPKSFWFSELISELIPLNFEGMFVNFKTQLCPYFYPYKLSFNLLLHYYNPNRILEFCERVEVFFVFLALSKTEPASNRSIEENLPSSVQI